MSSRMWYYLQGDQQIGPVRQEELVSLLIRGQVPADTYVWSEGMAQWQPANQLPELELPASMDGPMDLSALPASGRPPAVTVFGIINIIFGAFGLLCMPCAVAGLFMPQPAEPGPFAFDTGPVGYALTNYIISFALAILLVTTGIGLLFQKRRARQWAFGGGCFWIVWKIVSTTLNIILMGGGLFEMAEGEEMAEAFMAGAVFGIIFAFIFGLIYPVLLVIFMKRPNVIAACRR